MPDRHFDACSANSGRFNRLWCLKEALHGFAGPADSKTVIPSPKVVRRGVEHLPRVHRERVAHHDYAGDVPERKLDVAHECRRPVYILAVHPKALCRIELLFEHDFGEGEDHPAGTAGGLLNRHKGLFEALELIPEGKPGHELRHLGRCEELADVLACDLEFHVELPEGVPWLDFQNFDESCKQSREAIDVFSVVASNDREVFLFELVDLVDGVVQAEGRHRHEVPEDLVSVPLSPCISEEA